jgi:hypothetical protein
VLLAQLIPLVAATALFIATRAGVVEIPLIYGLVFFIAMSTVLQGPARQALLPSVVSREVLPRAITIGATGNSLARISGPAAAGGLIAATGVSGAYGAAIVLIITSMVALTLVRLLPIVIEGRRTVSIAAIREGVSFVFRRRVLAGVMLLDLFCVVFGGATALLPIFAEDILDVGPLGFGLLSASIEIGAVLMAAALVFLPQIDRAGRALFIAVAAFGLATIVFGLSRSLPLSLVAYMVVGMGDQASVVMRMTTIQLATPHELLGRVNSVNFLFAVSANELGAVESGLAAAAFGAPFAAVTGGTACLVALAGVWLRIPEMRDYRISEWRRSMPTAEAEPAT